MRFTKGMTVKMNIKAIHQAFGMPYIGDIQYDDFAKRYVLVNEDFEYCCCDGETVVVEQVDENLVIFRNSNGESDVIFALDIDEAEVAIFR